VDLNQTLALSTQNFLSALEEVSEKELSLPTPCEEWSVAELIWHVARGSDMAVLLLRGGSKAEATDVFKLAVASEVLSECRRALGAQTNAFTDAEDLELIVHHPMGDVTTRQFFDFRIMDLTLHSWDLARSIGASEELPDVLVTHVYEMLHPLKEVIGQIGIFGLGPTEDLDASTSMQMKLLDLSGRRP
jgi:uncharacterized protein (TIGR03086 family)